MTFKIKTLAVKNFMSVGNATQAVQFDRQDLTLVLGQNLDLGGDDTGARNGTGKTTIINALSYALYGAALTNIKKDNLINKTNGKNMLVTIEFEKDGIDYKIERGRKPNTMAFYVGGQEQEITDESQGDSRETQADIERMLGMSHDMFKHIVALNTYTEPFLALKANDQRAIIEQLLGITMLSEKADALKEQLKATRDAITQEEYRIKAVTDANTRIQEQIEATRRRQTMWNNKRLNDVAELERALAVIGDLDIEQELVNHDALDTYNEKTKKAAEINRWKIACETDK
jgi:DNA repair exonuclease SbcCD ATPase subunit